MFRILFFLFALSSLTSCLSTKDLIYLKGDYSKKKATTIANSAIEYKIQPHDVLNIRVQTLDQSTADFFNSNGYGGTSSQTNAASLYVRGYSVNDSGYVNIPLLGPVKMANMTVNEARNYLQNAINRQLGKASVDVKLLSFKISVLGEVNSPGYYFVYNDKCTVLEALALAGDLTLYGNRKNIKLIRHSPEGIKVVLIDLQDPDLLKSEYYYLLPSDELYVEPVKARARRQNFTTASLIFTGISTLILILNFASK